MDTSGPAPVTGTPVDRDSAGTEINDLQDELELVKEQLQNAIVQREAFKEAVERMRENQLTPKVREEHERNFDLVATLKAQVKEAKIKIVALEAALAAARAMLGWK